MAMATGNGAVEVREAPWARWLFASRAAAWIWLLVRVWLGYEWLHAAYEKIHTTAARQVWWSTGTALKGFAAGAIAAARQPERPQVAYGWWVSFLHWVSSNAAWIGLDRFVLARLGTPWERTVAAPRRDPHPTST